MSVRVTVSAVNLRRRRPRRRWLALALVPGLLLVCGPTANADTTTPAPWPGLPPQTIPDGGRVGGWYGTQGDGLSDVARAQQWIRIPAQAVATTGTFGPTTNYPADDPLGRDFTSTTMPEISLSSPKGAKEGYGIGLPVTVHTLAFGAIPVQVTLRIEQLRDASDLPIPLTGLSEQTHYVTSQQVRPGLMSRTKDEFSMTGRVRVRLISVSVDGVDLGLRNCVSPPIGLDLHGKPFWEGDPLADPNQHDPAFVADPASPTFAQGSTAAADWMAARGEAALNGGVVTGTIDIPAFFDCLTGSGEDLSPLLTGAVSGPGNPVTIGFGTISGVPGTNPPRSPCGTLAPPFYTTIGPRAPFLGDPSDCDPNFGPPTLPYPKRPS